VTSLFFLFVNQISPEPLNGFAPNSHGRRVWSLVRASLNVKGRGHQGQQNTLCTAITPSSDGMERARCKCRHAAADGLFLCCQGVILAGCVWFMFDKISSALVSDARVSVSLQLLWAVMTRVPLIHARI